MIRLFTIAFTLTFFVPTIAAASGNDFFPSTVSDTATAGQGAFGESVFFERLQSIEATIPLPYNEHVQKYIDIYLGRPSHFSKMLGLSEYYFPIFEKAFLTAGLPQELKFLSIIESALNPHAVSRSGAVGPWQFMFTTARGYGLAMDAHVDERKDPVKAGYAAARYFLDAYNRIGDWLLTIAAYNCGTGAVTRAIQRSGGVADFWKVRPFLPVETQNYVPAFIATLYVMNFHKEHGISPQAPAMSLDTDAIPLTKRLSFGQIADAAGIELNDLILLNPAYKKQVVNGSDDNPQMIVVPSLDKRSFASLYNVLNSDLQVPPAASAERHIVEPGQNLSQIANRYGIEVQDLKVWNNLKVNTVVPGQNLSLVPPKRPASAGERAYIRYVVKSGDTLSAIAARFKGSSVEAIKALNGLSKTIINPGMVLRISAL